MFKNCKKGFTLLELLVVVLIIGILAGVALPQYQKAIEKSKASQALTLIKSIDESILSYHLATGHYPTSFDQLDISIPESFNIDEKFVPNNSTYGKSSKDWNISVERYANESAVLLYIVHRNGKYKGAGFSIFYETSNTLLKGKMVCFERKIGANYLFNLALPEGSFCEKIIQWQFLSESDYSRYYTIN